MANEVLLSVGLTAEEDSALDEMTAEAGCAELVSVGGAEEALETLRSHSVACLVAASELVDGSGLELLRQSRSEWPEVGCLLRADAATMSQVAEEQPAGIEIVPADRTQTATRLAQLARVTIERRTQTPYPVPVEEPARLAALDRYRFDDESLVAELGRLTKLAAQHFDVPLSSVNLVRRETFEQLACHGVSPTTFGRDEVICAHTLFDEGTTVIENVAESCYASMQAVERYGIGWYAGTTLHTADGYPLGTFCVYDRTSRSFSTVDRRALELYAAETMAWIEHYRDQPSGSPEEPVAGDR
jgi:DNA-binding NarL/FixJ family response regulator